MNKFNFLVLLVLQTASGTRVREGGQLYEATGSIAFLHRESRFSVSYDHAHSLCSDSVVKGGSDVLGSSLAGETSPSQLAEVLAASDAEVEALLHSVFGDAIRGSQHFDLRAFCEQAVSHIPSILGKAAPSAAGLGCLDDGCGVDGVDVSEESLALASLTTVPSPTGSDVNTSMDLAPDEPDSPEELGRDLFRRALNVLFEIYPAVNENDDETPSSLLEEEATQQQGRNQDPAVTFGPRIRDDRHSKYRQYIIKASAWIATALRRLKSGRRLVQKWFVMPDSEVDTQIREARRHMTRMLSAMGRMLVKKGIPSAEPQGVCDFSNGAGTMAYVWTSGWCAVNSQHDCGQKQLGRYVVNICEFYWSWGFGEATHVGTMVHESSHHFGTGDKGYCSMVDCLALSSRDARNNADSYTHLIKELVKSSWITEEDLPSDLRPHKACNTPCNPASFQGNFDEWKFETMLPTGSCGECYEKRHFSLGPINLLGGDGCDAGLTEVKGGIVHKLCCKPHMCRTTTTTTTTTRGCPAPAMVSYWHASLCKCPGGYACSKNGRDTGCGFSSDKEFDISCRACGCYKTKSKLWSWFGANASHATA